MINLSPQQFASWNEPLDMLYACHSKIQRFCRQLQILPDYVAKNGVNQAVKNDVQQIIYYFNKAAPLHHQDEDEDFFPVLPQYVPKEKQHEVETTMAALSAQHHQLHQNWAALCVQLEQLLNQQIDNVDPQLVQRFTDGYAKHIALEEPLFELGKQYLPEAKLQAMGKLMFARRQS